MKATGRTRWHIMRAEPNTWMLYLARLDDGEWFPYRKRVIAWTWRDWESGEHARDEPMLTPLPWQWESGLAATDFDSTNACAIGLYVGDEVPEADALVCAANEVCAQLTRLAARARARHDGA
jgi:hypothetical protein